ncbi:hypothetical protein HNQ52_000506 [Chiayiivirga flava]|uniref:Uncharacterized protein n=1 Tax=Chiayiivirga flava TaxID=659595 RepID=A0A7W8G0T9_9GAMM|nr:hypothetical protein [Chiayiivirga flava]
MQPAEKDTHSAEKEMHPAGSETHPTGQETQSALRLELRQPAARLRTHRVAHQR